MTPGDRRVVLGIGEVLWDCFPDRRLPGGAPANVVYHATQLGHRGALCSRVGVDADGDELVAQLRDRGLDLRLLQRDRERPTGRVTVESTDPTAPRFEIHEDAAWDAIETAPELEAVASSAAALCVGTLVQRSDRSRATVQGALRLAAQALTVYDVNLRPPFHDPAWIEPTLRFARVVKLNEEEARVLAGMLRTEDGDAESFARTVIERYDVETVFVTRGADGCLAVSVEGIHDEPGLPVKVVDSVGAGDAFTAGLVSGLLRGWDLARTSRLANRLGAEVASRPGAMPNLDDRVELILDGIE